MINSRNLNIKRIIKYLLKNLYRLKEYPAEIMDGYLDTRRLENYPLIENSYIETDKLDLSNIDKDIAGYLTSMYLGHRYDILGSGWVENTYSSIALGIEDIQYNMNMNIGKFDNEGNWIARVLKKPYVEKSVQLWQNVSRDYTPIDWQKDIKSGYRWNEKKWYKSQSYPARKGADIKTPWEMARLQHLPQLGINAILLKESRHNIIVEYKNQVLDFVALNPPRIGVNWTCTMDVAIRAANILLAYDIMSQVDETQVLDQSFKVELSQSMYLHGKHIVNNLEWNGSYNTNHYLSNIFGLLFISAYLESTEETDAWFSFSLQELISEVKKQFYEDGGNYESSTSYHRLSSELYLYASAIAIKARRKKRYLKNNYSAKWNIFPKLLSPDEQLFDPDNEYLFPQWYYGMLYKMGEFSIGIIKPNGEVPQFGDNDSGRIFKLTPCGELIDINSIKERYLNLKNYRQDEKFYWDENSLDQRALISLHSGLFDKNTEQANIFPFEKSIISNLKGGIVIPETYLSPYIPDVCPAEGKGLDIIEKLCFTNQTVIKSKTSNNLSRNIKLTLFEKSGIFTFRSDYMYLSICATPNGQNGKGGHTHCDKLSFELVMDGDNLFRDPGSYLYTPIVKQRNKFRSINAHNTIITDRDEQLLWNDGHRGLFGLYSNAKIQLLEFSSTSIMIKCEYRDVIHVRQFIIEEDRIVINDYANRKFYFNSGFNYYSSGYGKIEKTKENINCGI